MFTSPKTRINRGLYSGACKVTTVGTIAGFNNSTHAVF